MRSRSKSTFLLKASAVYVTALLSCVFVFIIVCAADGFFMGGRGLFTSVWHPESKQFGILPVIAATAALSLSSLALGWLVSFGCVCYIHGFGGKRGGALLLSLLRVMTAIPTVVYGFASVFLLVPIVRNGFGGSGLSWFTATLILAVRESGLTAASLGFSRAEHLVFVVLPSCREWLWGAALLGFGRAAGDTMIPTMLAGNAVQYPTSPLNAIRPLTAHIGLVLSSDVGGTAYYSLFAAGGVLLALSAGANLVFRAIRKDKKS